MKTESNQSRQSAYGAEFEIGASYILDCDMMMAEICNRNDMTGKSKYQHKVEISGQLYAVPISRVAIIL